ncbi:PepSY domain-containing protein [uncultured Kocuria sp.]|uniref:PepSY domain-containing protein n=1 Tax=uncultured Kocuria sp. TaxID=259305 RepID=UPI00261A7EAB|nr:PepSY domain-containing protein [uncultured Kocuria sp.]
MLHIHRRPLSLAALAVSALLLAGCGDGGDGGAGEDGATAPADTSAPAQDTATPDDSASPGEDATGDGTAAPSGSASPSGSPGADSTAGAGGEAAVVSSAVAAAQDAVGDDARAFEIAREDSPASWQIAVASGDREHELYVSQDGEDVISQEEEGGLDSDDREKLARVQVSLEDGLSTALETVNGTLDEAQLETEDGSTVWEVEIDEPDGNSVDVFVDVENGSVLKIDR